MKTILRSILIHVVLLLGFSVSLSAQAGSVLTLDEGSFRLEQTNALGGVNIDPIGKDRSNRSCFRLKLHLDRMTPEDIRQVDVILIGGNVVLMKRDVAYGGNGLIVEMTARPNTRFYIKHPSLGESNTVTVSPEPDKVYLMDGWADQKLTVGVYCAKPGADVWLDGVFRGKIGQDKTLNISDVMAGPHSLKVQSGAKCFVQQIEASSEKVLFIVELKSEVQSIARETITVKGVSFDMIMVYGGTFTMGATLEQGSDAYDTEKPTHKVTLSDYYIGETEVTQALWQAVMGKNPSYFKGNNNPVEQVSWKDCQKFIAKLNKLTGRVFRLPTEAEWEFAARGGRESKGYKYSGSNDVDNVAWYYGNSDQKTHAVKTKSPNELVIYDMSGNVQEWCQDYWHGSYGSSAQTNPQGPSNGSYRVLRGGTLAYFASYGRVSGRGIDSPVSRDMRNGLRLVLVP